MNPNAFSVIQGNDFANVCKIKIFFFVPGCVKRILEGGLTFGIIDDT